MSIAGDEVAVVLLYFMHLGFGMCQDDHAANIMLTPLPPLPTPAPIPHLFLDRICFCQLLKVDGSDEVGEDCECGRKTFEAW